MLYQKIYFKLGVTSGLLILALLLFQKLSLSPLSQTGLINQGPLSKRSISVVAPSEPELSPLTNRPPQVFAGSDQTINASTANLFGTANDDGLPNPPSRLSFQWQKVGGPGEVLWGNQEMILTTASFSDPGSYTLRLTVSDGLLSASDDLAINASCAGNTLPTPALASLSGGEVGQPVIFNASGSHDLDGQALEYKFNFGDGVTTDWLATPIIPHTYNQTGSYSILLWVRDTCGGESEPLMTSVLIEVAAPHQASLVRNINPGTSGSNPTLAAQLNATTFLFAATHNTSGRELWRSDGSAVETRLVKDINLTGSAANSFPQSFVTLNDLVLFTADDGVHGREWWRSNGTSTGTALVKDVYPGNVGSDPIIIGQLGNEIYFAANDGVHAREIWKTDGTEAGTVLVRDISLTGNGVLANAPDVRSGGVLGDYLYFVGNDLGPAFTDWELWRTDGTEAGTTLVKNINPTSNSLPEGFLSVGSSLYFTAWDGVHGEELWKTNGTEAGTIMVKNINPNEGFVSSGPRRLTKWNNQVYFSADDGVFGYELWKTDGSLEGTVLVTDIFPGANSSLPDELMVGGNSFYFVADDGVHGAELWRTNGTAFGTALVKDIYPGSEAGEIRDLTWFNGELFFGAKDSLANNELWLSDGTAQGTAQVQEIYSGLNGAYPNGFFPINNRLYFAADNGLVGVELWGY